MIEKLVIAQRMVVEEVLNLQRLSYKIEADLIGFTDLPPLKESIADLQSNAEDFYGSVIGNQLCGVISVQVVDGVMEICRLCVHPAHFRKGIAKQLLQYVEQQLYEYEEIRVSTGTDNYPAIRFYQRNDFSKVRQIRTAEEGLSLTFFSKKRKNS